MVSAVSADLSQVPAASASYHWFKMPDLNRQTHRRLGQSGAGWTFETICRLVHHVGRVGRPKARQAARELGRLGVGLQAIADEAGISVAKVRRDLVKLSDLGLVTVHRRNTTGFVLDPATGRIRENRTGRSLPVVVFVTVGIEHLRTKAGQERPSANPANLEGQGAPHRDHPGGAIQREKKSERRPDGDACGIGSPPAEPETGLPAGETLATRESATTAIGRENASQGRLPAAKASQERVPVRMDAADDDLPVPIGRISRPMGKSAPPRPQRRTDFPEDRREPEVWTGWKEQARLRMLAEMDERRRRDAAADERAKAAGSLSPRQRAMMEVAR
ncbi:MAG: hypothetical protein EBZ74_09795 [Planctomycetia bacterium]|nr:hypothetical protein [Planctomycetia bacterium]